MPFTKYSKHLINVSHYYGRRQWHPTPVLLLGKSHGQRSLVGCSPQRRCQSDTTEQLRFHFSLSCIGEGNGNPLQCSCLENPRDGGAWWASVYGVAQSRTRLKRLSSSSSSISFPLDRTFEGLTNCRYSSSDWLMLFFLWGAMPGGLSGISCLHLYVSYAYEVVSILKPSTTSLTWQSQRDSYYRYSINIFWMNE